MSYAYHQPKNLEQLLSLRRELPEARLIAGGTDLLVQLDQGRFEPPPALISLRGVQALCRVEEHGEGLRIGAGVTMSQLLRSRVIERRYPALHQALAVVGSKQIRNVATLAGNLCNASPAADTAPPLLTYEASLELRSASSQRKVSALDFFVGPGKTTLSSDEVLTAITLPKQSSQARSVFLRKGRVKMDLALVSVALWAELRGGSLDDIRIGAGSVGPTPLRLRKTEALLGAEGLAAFERAATLAGEEIMPIDDLRCTARQRRRLVATFVHRGLAYLLSEGRKAS